MEKKHSKKNKSLLQAYINIAKADGNIHPKELELLLQFGKKFGFTSDEINEQIKSSSDNIEPKIPINTSNKLSLIMDFFRLAIADGHVDEKEVDIIRTYTLQLGYTEELFEELVADTKSQLNLLQSA